MKLHRTVVRAYKTEHGQVELYVAGCVTKSVIVPRNAVPEDIQEAMKAGTEFFFAMVNLNAETEDEFRVENWEIADPKKFPQPC